ncbi:MAG TPA: NAD(P)H-binding protein, partial [Anaeromyxobacteraceae bacterium]|nr:NAD(P)H-binding protein [Anaeromyxobacteraceae bacterium]
MRWLLTGATGFIGLTLAGRLRERGHAVRALARASSRVAELEGLGVELCRGDVTDPRSLQAAVEGCQA